MTTHLMKSDILKIKKEPIYNDRKPRPEKDPEY